MPTADLHDALQDLSEAINRRLVIVDERLRVVAYSIHESEIDRTRLSVILAHSDSWRVPPAGSDTQIREVPGIGRVVLTPLRDHRHRVGFLLLALEEKERTLPLAIETVLAQNTGELGLMLSLRALYAERDRNRVRSLLKDLLRPDPVTRISAALALVDDGLLGASRQYSAVVLGPDPRDPGHDPNRADTIARHAVEATLDFLGQTSSASAVGAGIGDGLGILVFPRAAVKERFTRILRRELGVVRAGLGPLVADLTSIGDSFQRARDAWRVGVATGAESRVLTWSEVGLDRLLVRLPLEAITVSDLPTPVRNLLTADLGDELLATLEAYLAHGGDAAATARALHIHRSSLYYRLDRLRSIGDLDLADGILRRELHTGLRIAELAGLVP